MLARLRRLALLPVTVGLLGSFAVAVPASARDIESPASAAVDSDDDGILDALDPASAAVSAAAENEPVEDLSQRTETVTVAANPDGTFTSKQFATPVRVKQAGEWVDVDYTLKKQSDGSYAPKASDLDISIDGGTAKEAARVTFEDGESLAFTWPADLPEPTIEGGVATYKISEATDLVVAVTGSGVTARIRLNEQPAADDPVFTFGLRADDLDVDQTAAGGLKVTDGDGKTVGTTTQLSAWDADVDAAGDPADVVPLDATLTEVSSTGDITKQELELTTPDGYLSDPDTTYPVTIDPDISGIISHRDMWVRANDSASHAGDYRLMTGRLGGTDNTSSAMSYLQFINTQLADKDITSAKVGLWQYSSATCADRRLSINPIAESWTSATDWDDRPSIRSTEPTLVFANRGNSASCSDGWTMLDITDMAQKWSDGTYPNYGMRLSSSGGSDPTYDRRFCSRNPDTSTTCNTAARTPYLSITYNQAPSAVAYAPTVDQTTPASTKISAVVTDPDEASLWAEFTVKRGAAVVFRGLSTSGSGTTQSVDIPDLPKGQYTVTARAYDGRLFSSNSSASASFSVADDLSQVLGDSFSPRASIQVASITIPGGGQSLVPIAGPAGVPANEQSDRAAVVTMRVSGWSSVGGVSVVNPVGEPPATPGLGITSAMSPSTPVETTSIVALSEAGEGIVLNTSPAPVTVVLTVQGWFSLLTDVDPASQSQADHGVAPVPAGYDRLADTPEAIASQPTQDALESLYTLYDEKLFGARPVSTDGATSAQGAIFLQSSDSQTLDERIADAQEVVEELTETPIEEVLPEPQLDPEDEAGAFPSALSTTPASAALPAAICSPMPGCTGEAYKLPLTHSSQSNCSWCGPASTAMALRASGASNTSDADGTTMTQARLASSDYLQTTIASGTNITRIPVTLKKWAKIQATIFYSPSSGNLADIVRVSVKGYKRAVMYGTQENASFDHYNGHPKTRTIRHFITGYGFSDYGRRVKYADPVSGAGCFAGNIAKTNSMKASSMAGFINPYGVVARGKS